MPGPRSSPNLLPSPPSYDSLKRRLPSRNKQRDQSDIIVIDVKDGKTSFENEKRFTGRMESGSVSDRTSSNRDPLRFEIPKDYIFRVYMDSEGTATPEYRCKSTGRVNTAVATFYLSDGRPAWYKPWHRQSRPSHLYLTNY